MMTLPRWPGGRTSVENRIEDGGRKCSGSWSNGSAQKVYSAPQWSLAAYRYVSLLPTMTAGDTHEALIADPRSDISSKAPAGTGIRLTLVRALRSRR